MIICNLCKRDPVANEKNEALKNQPWGVVLTPPPGSGLPEMRLCWACTQAVFQVWVMSVHPEDLKSKPK